MNISDLADKLENENIFPEMVFNRYHNNNYGKIETIFKYEFDIDTNIIFNKDFIYNDEYYPDENGVTKYSYTYYFTDNGLYYTDKDFLNMYKDKVSIPFSIYYKDVFELPKEFQNITLVKPKLIKNFDINPVDDFVYTTFKNERYSMIDDTIIQYKNFPLIEYDKILQPHNQFNYLVNNDKWVSSRKTPEHTYNSIKSFLTEGYIKPIILQYVNGNYLPIACNCKVITAKLFNMPFIPTIILYSNENYDIMKKVIGYKIEK